MATNLQVVDLIKWVGLMKCGSQNIVENWKLLRIRYNQRNLSTAIVHLLSMKLVAESNAAGHANAVTNVLNTVTIAPCFINPNVRPE